MITLLALADMIIQIAAGSFKAENTDTKTFNGQFLYDIATYSLYAIYVYTDPKTDMDRACYAPIYRETHDGWTLSGPFKAHTETMVNKPIKGTRIFFTLEDLQDGQTKKNFVKFCRDTKFDRYTIMKRRLSIVLKDGKIINPF